MLAPTIAAPIVTQIVVAQEESEGLGTAGMVVLLVVGLGFLAGAVWMGRRARRVRSMPLVDVADLEGHPEGGDEVMVVGTVEGPERHSPWTDQPGALFIADRLASTDHQPRESGGSSRQRHRLGEDGWPLTLRGTQGAGQVLIAPDRDSDAELLPITHRTEVEESGGTGVSVGDAHQGGRTRSWIEERALGVGQVVYASGWLQRDEGTTVLGGRVTLADVPPTAQARRLWRDAVIAGAVALVLLGLTAWLQVR